MYAMLEQFKVHEFVLKMGSLEQYNTFSLVQCAVYYVQCFQCSELCRAEQQVYCSVHCSVYSVQCAVCSVQCTMYSVQCTIYSVHCAVCSVQYAQSSVQCAKAVCSVQCTVCSMQCAVCRVQCLQCAVCGVRCAHTDPWLSQGALWSGHHVMYFC